MKQNRSCCTLATNKLVYKEATQVMREHEAQQTVKSIFVFNMDEYMFCSGTIPIAMNI